MALLNLSIPHADVYVRPVFLFDGKRGDEDPPEPCRIVGVASVAGRALGFHILTARGAVFWRLPIHALCWRPDAPQQALHELQLWDCFGDEITYECFDALGLSCVAHLPDGQGALKPHDAEYIGTFDWLNNAYSDTPEQHKCAHWLRLANGNFCLQPNNRIYPWHEPAYVFDPIKGEHPGYETNTHMWRCETRQWVAGDGFFYGEKKAE